MSEIRIQQGGRVEILVDGKVFATGTITNAHSEGALEGPASLMLTITGKDALRVVAVKCEGKVDE